MKSKKNWTGDPIKAHAYNIVSKFIGYFGLAWFLSDNAFLAWKDHYMVRTYFHKGLGDPRIEKSPNYL